MRDPSIESVTTCTATHALPDGEVELLGACDTVIGAMTRIDCGGVKLLVDCGKPSGDTMRAWRLPPEACRVDAVVLTHGHADHVGAVPDLLDAGFGGPLVATAATHAIARINLRDGIMLAGGTELDVARCLARYEAQARAVEYGARVQVGGDSIEVRLYEAGHILGSASVEVTSPRSRVLCSGDLGRPGSPLLHDYHTSYGADRPLDVVVLESTYGDRDHATTPTAVADALAVAIDRARRDGGHILVPSFAIGRTQALLYHLNALVESGRIDDLPVAVDSPMAIRVTELYARSRRLFDAEATGRLRRGDDPLDFDGLYAVRRGRDSDRLRDAQAPVMFIAGSGMCTGGRIVRHLQELLPRPETCVLFVGYQATGTPGRRIQQAAPGERVRVGGLDVPVRAEVVTVSGLSAHADRRELAAWLDRLPPVRRLALHHGEPPSQWGFERWLSGPDRHVVSLSK